MAPRIPTFLDAHGLPYPRGSLAITHGKVIRTLLHARQSARGARRCNDENRNLPGISRSIWTISYDMYGHMSSRFLWITAKGMGFLTDDGGLSPILDVVTVKLHEDTLKELIGQRIAESDLPAPEKSRLLDQLKSLPGETIKHLTLKLVDVGLSNRPAALQAIETFAHRAI